MFLCYEKENVFTKGKARMRFAQIAGFTQKARMRFVQIAGFTQKARICFAQIAGFTQ